MLTPRLQRPFSTAGFRRAPRFAPPLRSALLVLLALTAPGLGAQEAASPDDSQQAESALGTERPRIAFNGFGTLGFVHSGEERADFVANQLRPDGAGFTREWSPEIDSRLGLQVSASLTPRVSAVVQVVVEQQHDGDIEPGIEWANLRYSFTRDFSLRIGRTALPIFASSDYRKVAYANPWVRPPIELYGLVPIFQIDGVDMSYRHRFRGWTETLQATLGFSDIEVPSGSTLEIRQMVGLFDTLERGDLSIHTALATARATVPDPGLFEGFRAFGDEGRALADRFEVDDERLTFATLGVSYDSGPWFIQAELGRIWTDSFIVDRTAGYVSAGWRVGSLTPYATYSESRADDPLSSPGLTLSRLPPELIPVAAALNAALNETLANSVAQRSVSAGLRWDYHRNVALKLQVDRIDVAAGSYGSFTQRQADFSTGGGATLVAVSADFVF